MIMKRDRNKLNGIATCQAGEPGGRLAVAVRALRCELPKGNAEDSGQLPDFSGGETSLPSVETRASVTTIVLVPSSGTCCIALVTSSL